MRFKKRIDLNELKSVYQPNSYISFNLPKGKVDLHSLTLYYDGNPANYQHTENGVLTPVIKTFNSESSTIVRLTGATVYPPSSFKIINHGFTTGQEIIYETDGGNPITPLTDGNPYFVIKIDSDNFRIADSLILANAGTFKNMTNRGTGTNHSFRYNVVGGTGGGFRTIRRCFPRLSSSIIQELIVKIDNRIVQHLQEYNTLYAILNDIYKEYDDIDSNNVDTVQAQTVDADGNIKNSSKIQAIDRAQTNVSKYFESHNQKFFIDKFLGFLGEGNRYIDTTDKNIQVQIKLAPANILYRGCNTKDEYYLVNASFVPDYMLTDIYATVDVVDDAITSSDFVFKDYLWVSGDYLPNNKKCFTSFQTNKPVNWVLGTFMNPNRLVDSELQLMHCSKDNSSKFGEPLQTMIDMNDVNNRIPNELLYSYEIAKFQKEPYLLNSSIYFDRQGKCINYCQYKLNNYDLTPKLDLVACYNETKKCFGSDYKKVASINSFEENFFVNAIRLDDTSQELKNIEWSVEIANPSLKYNSGGFPMLFCCLTNTL